MKTLLVINDGTPQGDHAAKFALIVARALAANIVIANSCKTVNIAQNKNAFAVIDDELTGHSDTEMSDGLIKPEINEVDISAFNETELAEFSNREQIWMIIKGMADHSPETLSKKHININVLMNKVRCPLLLVPFHWHLKQIESLAYIADLRYCRLQSVRYLVELAKPWNAIVSVANLSAKGLPDMCEAYAEAVFENEIYRNVNYEKLLLNNIKERDVNKAVDVMINGMHNDVLVMVNHRFHFEEIMGTYITEKLPAHITVPLLIFPY